MQRKTIFQMNEIFLPLNFYETGIWIEYQPTINGQRPTNRALSESPRSSP
jgi:hypothetical protein